MGSEFMFHQGVKRSLADLKETNQILSSTNACPAISAVHISGVDNFAERLSQLSTHGQGLFIQMSSIWYEQPTTNNQPAPPTSTTYSSHHQQAQPATTSTANTWTHQRQEYNNNQQLQHQAQTNKNLTTTIYYNNQQEQQNNHTQQQTTRNHQQLAKVNKLQHSQINQIQQ